MPNIICWQTSKEWREYRTVFGVLDATAFYVMLHHTHLCMSMPTNLTLPLTTNSSRKFTHLAFPPRPKLYISVSFCNIIYLLVQSLHERNTQNHQNSFCIAGCSHCSENSHMILVAVKARSTAGEQYTHTAISNNIKKVLISKLRCKNNIKCF